eukprot:1049387-Prymnesium_polylepis.1
MSSPTYHVQLYVHMYIVMLFVHGNETSFCQRSQHALQDAALMEHGPWPQRAGHRCLPSLNDYFRLNDYH